MSQTLEIPDALYAAMERAAQAKGMTPIGWIAAQLSSEVPRTVPQEGEPPKTLADLFQGRLGRIASNGQETLSEQCGERFTDYLEEKRKEGHL
jgi:hypothetical protein